MENLLNTLFLKHPSGLLEFSKTLINVYYEQFYDNYLDEQEAVFLLIRSAVDDVYEFISENEIEYLSDRLYDNIPLIIMCLYIKRLSVSEDVEYHDTCVFEFENLYKLITVIFNNSCPTEFKIDSIMSTQIQTLYFNFWNVND